MEHGYSYGQALAASERVNWRVEDLIGGDRKLDFGKRFLPESLARVEPLGFLSPDERRILTAAERALFTEVQHQAQRWTFLGSGMTHRNVLATVEFLKPDARTKLEEVAPAFC